jgi:NADPH2:quinone reductase
MKIKAVVATAKGGPEVLRLQDVDLPWPQGPSDVLVTLRAAALNPADVFFRQLGGYVEGPSPFVLGHDGMGVVSAVGPAVTTVKPGDRVCFCNGGIGGVMGTYAEAAVVPDWQLARVPDSVDDATAAALPLVSITCWEALYDRANVQAGEHAGQAAPAMWPSSWPACARRAWQPPSVRRSRRGSLPQMAPTA